MGGSKRRGLEYRLADAKIRVILGTAMIALLALFPFALMIWQIGWRHSLPYLAVCAWLAAVCVSVIALLIQSSGDTSGRS